MQAKKRMLTVLLGLLAMLGLALLALMLAQQKTDTADAVISVTDFAAADAGAISYEYLGETIELQKGENGWLLADDPAYHVEQTAADSMVTALCGMEAQRQIDGVADYAQYGLDTPALTVTAMFGSETVTLHFGDENSMTGDRYLRRGDEAAVYMVAAAKYNVFCMTKTDLYDAGWSPLLVPQEELSELRWTYRAGAGQYSGALVLEKTESEDETGETVVSSAWYAASDRNPLDQEMVVAMTEALYAAPAGQITAAADLADYGLDAPLLQVTLSDGSTEQTCRVGLVGDAAYLLADGDSSVYLVDAALPAAFAYSQADLVDTTALHAAQNAAGEGDLTVDLTPDLDTEQ